MSFTTSQERERMRRLAEQMDSPPPARMAFGWKVFFTLVYIAGVLGLINLL